jgi:hypothetical protein
LITVFDVIGCEPCRWQYAPAEFEACISSWSVR